MKKKYSELTDKDYEHKVDTVDGDTLYFKTAVSQNVPQDFTNLDTTQKLFVKHFLQSADTLIRKYQPSATIDNFTAKTLDNIIDLWNSESSKFTCTDNNFANTIGVAFGHLLVNTFKMKWTIVTDEYGTDYATTLSEIKLTNFPLNSVVKAIEQKREGSLQQIILINKKQIAEIKNTQ